MNKIKTLFLMGLAAGTTLSAAPLADGACKFLGNITTGGQVRSDMYTYWNQITAENECKWASIEGTRGNYNFSGCDRAYNWAKQNGAHFKFHALVWGSQYPSWLNGLSTEETKKAITNWMDAVAKHYPDLEMIDVVNEAIRTGNNSYHSPYGQNNNIIPALGGDNGGNYQFVVTAFKMARERWPNAILIYNDYNTVQWQKNEGIDLINKIKAAGAPVDAYGLQAHDMMSQGGGAGGTGGGGACLNINTLKSVIGEIWQKTQMPMFISEYDIASADDNVQKQCYQEQISYFMENEHIAGITLWGYIYGQTWVSGGTSGIIKDGRDRAAMTWLKDYFASSKDKCQNSTGLAGGKEVDPVPQEPYGGKAAEIPGKIEIENFDVSGAGKDENGKSNISYSEGDGENHGDADYRADEKTGVDFYKGGSGTVIGYTNAGEWFEYTVNVAKDGEYTVFASVASGNETSSFKIYVDDQDVSGEIAVPKTGEDWNTYKNVKVPLKSRITAGKHVVKFEVVGAYVNVDYLNFVEGANAEDPEIPSAITQNVNMAVDVFGLYDIFDMQGVQVGRLGAYNMDQAVSTVKNGNLLSKGIYQLRSRNTGKVQTLRIAK
ncbi:MAG: endo-1,4-beta-xylanase [Fibrobacteraceae bacterium]|nr:endo-1,4-beta-xylanase [Fibrobacteraceae bacterium]